MKNALPHSHVYARLMRSPIHGIGVFAIRSIKKGTLLFDNNEEIVWIDEQNIKSLPIKIRQVYEDFAIIKDGLYGCPVNFNNMTMGWYMNDSDHPNILVDKDYNMWAARDIAEGEELTIDSSKFSKQPYKEVASVAAK